MFKPGFDKYTIVDLCHPMHPDIARNQSRRWSDSLNAISAGTFFHRPNYRPDHPHEFHYHEPIWDRLQSSYDDVQAELDIMRKHPMHKHSLFMLVGGDGLAVHRLNHTINRHPQTYLRTPPAIIPVQGEHPHGTCHILHMGWRPYAPLLLGILTAIGHHECRADFTVSKFNDYDHAVCILMEGVAKYFLELSRVGDGMPPLRNAALMARHCEKNIDLLWLFHFLHGFAFLYWDMRQSVRSNQSEAIDLIWRECVSFLHTDGAHKTQYAPMAILRVFWGQAMHPALASVYHRNRTLSLTGLPGSNVGYDMPIEKENLAISLNVTNASRESISRYVRELNFTAPVSRAAERELRVNVSMKPRQMKKIKDDVDAVVEYLKKTLGACWSQACVPRDQGSSKLLDRVRRPRRPWVAIEELGQSHEFSKWVKGHLDTKISWM